MVADVPVLAEGLCFSHRRLVLDEFALAVPRGTAVVLLGENGAGKTTALDLLAGALNPGSGRVRINGGDPRRVLVRRGLFHLPEFPTASGLLTAEENLRYVIDLHAAPRARHKEVRALLDRVGLAAERKRPLRTFSKGMVRRVEIAQLLAVDAPVWVVDEPESGLDPAGVRLWRTLVREAVARGRTVVFASHALRDAVLAADHVVVLRGGRTLFAGDRAALSARLGASGITVRGGDDALAAMRVAAAAQGAEIGPAEVALDALEALVAGGKPS